MDLIESFYRKEKAALKRRVEMVFLHAEVTAGYLFPGKGQTEPPYPWDYYPKLFEKEQKAHDAARNSNELDDCISRRKAYALEFNRRRQQSQ